LSSSPDRISDRVRSISLRELLAWHGFSLKREGISFRAKDDRYNIVIHGDKGFDNRADVGGTGAMDLQIRLNPDDFVVPLDRPSWFYAGCSPEIRNLG
jgi:hypothetical protein